MNLETIEKIIDLTIFIKNLITLAKSRNAYLNSIKGYMDGITQSMVHFKQSYKEGKLKMENFPIAFSSLETALSQLKTFLEKENSANSLMKFIKGSMLRKTCKEFIDEINTYVMSLNLAVAATNTSLEIRAFDELEKRFDIVDEKLGKIAINKTFRNSFAADFWIQSFGEDTLVDSVRFLEKFKVFVHNQEKINLNELQMQNILALMDENQQKTVSCEQWDNFYNEIWSFFERRTEIFQASKPILGHLSEKFGELILIYDGTNEQSNPEYDFKIGHSFKITDEFYEFVDSNGKKVRNDKDLTKEGVIVGKKKQGANPDIYFDPQIKTISGRQFQITAKKYQDAKGYFISDLSSTNFTALKVEKKPYALSQNTVIDINGHVFAVTKVNPEPIDENNSNYFMVPTSGMVNVGKSLMEKTINKTKRKRQHEMKNEERKSGVNSDSDDDNGDKKDENTLKRKPRVVNPNKLITPTLILECLEGSLAGQKPIELLAKSKKGPFVASIGSAKDNDIFIDDPGTIYPYNCQIVYHPDWSCWVIVEAWPGSKQEYLSEGTLIHLKSAEDFKKNQAASFACKLRNGMKIFFNCHVLAVILKES